MSKQLREIWEMSLAWFVTFIIFGGLVLLAIPMTIFFEKNTPQTFIEEAGGSESLVYLDTTIFDPEAQNEDAVTDPASEEHTVENETTEEAKKTDTETQAKQETFVF